MSNRNAIWNDLPPGLDERVLLAWIEDELSEAERGRVEAALRARPALLGRLDAMRGDRLTLRSLGEERAPAHLLDSIEQTLERDALLGLASGEDLYTSPPVSMVRPRKNGWGMWTPARQGLALAAGVAVAAGVGLWLWPQLQSGGGAPAPEEPGPLVLADPAPETGPEASAPIAPFVAPEPVVAEAPELPLETFIELPGPAPMGLERALALAGEGRLAIRVSSERFDVAWQRVSQLTGQPARARGWRLRADDTGVATALLPRGVDVAPGHGLLLDPGVMASRGDGGGAWTPPQIGLSQPDWDFGAERLGRSYIAHFALTEASLGALVDQLATGGEVVLEELLAPLWLEGPVSADAILWWGATASAAGQWGSAPVVVTPAE